MTATVRRAREALRKVGSRRGRLNKQTDSLRRDTKRALVRAKKASIPVTEAATLVGVSRSTAYEVYLQGESNADSRTSTNPRSADGGPPKRKRHPVPTRKVEGSDARQPKRRRQAASAGTSN